MFMCNVSVYMCICMDVPVPQGLCGCLRTIWGSLFSPLDIHVTAIEFRSPGLALSLPTKPFRWDTFSY